MRKVKFAQGEYYHIFNRGVDKRAIFLDLEDFQRFLRSMKEFNNTQTIGSIYYNQFSKNKLRNSVPKTKLVNFICYCLNPNHYHFILEQLINKGIEKFMHKLGVGYTNFFNKRYKRSGSLFQGAFKAVHINSDEYLLHLSAYVNLNNKVHQFENRVFKSSWDEYKNLNKVDFCNKDIVLNQFKDVNSYINFAESSLEDIKRRKDIEKMLLE